MSELSALPRSAQTSWRGFVETFEPLRTDPYRCFRSLTPSPCDADDLALGYDWRTSSR